MEDEEDNLFGGSLELKYLTRLMGCWNVIAFLVLTTLFCPFLELSEKPFPVLGIEP